MKMLLMLVVMISGSVFADSEDFVIKSGTVCFNECKKSGGFLGIGSKQGFDRPSCEPCMRAHPDKFSFNEDGDGNGVVIASQDACFSECKPKKQILGIAGKLQVGYERNSCVTCLQANPTTRRNMLPAFQTGAINQVPCTVSGDRQYAVCHGDIYKLDSSSSNGDRTSITADKEAAAPAPAPEGVRLAPRAQEN